MNKKILYPYQRKGVRKIDHFDGRALLADEMGLGKTLQSLAWTFWRQQFPLVVICPAGLRVNWQREILKFFGEHADICEGRDAPQGKVQFASRILIISYEILEHWLPYFHSMWPVTVIIDECHRVKNPSAKCTKATKQICDLADNVIALSGTPFTNRPAELWTVLNIVRPDVWPTFLPYAMDHCQPRRTRWGWQYKGAVRLPMLNSKLNQFCMIRRRKKDVLKDLPDKTRTIIPIRLKDRREYDAAEKDFLSWLGAQSKVKAKKAKSAQKLVMMGYLKRLAAKLKMPFANEWIKDALTESDEKLVVYGWHTDILEPLHQRHKKESVLISGKVTGNKRQDAVDRFQEEDDCRLLVGNIKAGGVGLNLTAASTGAFIELGMTPADHLQVEDRLHRIGQTKKVHWYYLIAENTVEEDLCSMIQGKQEAFDAAIDGKELGSLDIFDQLVHGMKRRLLV